MDPSSVLTIHEKWLRFYKGPFEGTWLGLEAAWEGIRQIVSGQNVRFYWTPAIGYGLDPLTTARDNVELCAFFALAVIAMIGAFRRLPLAYGAYVAVFLLATVSYPIAAQPFAGMGQYLVPLFPVQMVIARWLAVHRRWRLPLGSFSVAALVYYAGAFATWHATGSG